MMVCSLKFSTHTFAWPSYLVEIRDLLDMNTT